MRHRYRQPAAFTLVELIISMSLSVVLMGAMTSVILISTRSVAITANPSIDTREAADILGRMTSELRNATSVSERTSIAVTFTVPDRDNDGGAEEIRYAWSGTPGDPLTRRYNGGSEIAIATSVTHFDLDYLLRTTASAPQACCQSDGTCSDDKPEDCIAADGTPWGLDSECSTTECPVNLRVLLVVNNADSPSTREASKKAKFESWSLNVGLLSSGAGAGEYNTALGDHDVVYVCDSANADDIGTKLNAAAIGVLSESRKLASYLGLSQAELRDHTNTDIQIENNNHYITLPLNLGPLTLASSGIKLLRQDSDLAPGATTLAAKFDDTNRKILITLEPGSALYGGGTAAGHRVALPWGVDVEITDLNDAGLDLLRRALDWAADNEQPSCRDGTCDPGETACNCPDDCVPPAPPASESGSYCSDSLDNDCDGVTDCEDPDCTGFSACECGNDICNFGEDFCNCSEDCGPAPASEGGGANCSDGEDNDCDGDIDCDDADCNAVVACSCGNGVCEPGEDCVNCDPDCDSRVHDDPDKSYCCGDGTLQPEEGDGSMCDGNP